MVPSIIDVWGYDREFCSSIICCDINIIFKVQEMICEKKCRALFTLRLITLLALCCPSKNCWHHIA